VMQTVQERTTDGRPGSAMLPRLWRFLSGWYPTSALLFYFLFLSNYGRPKRPTSIFINQKDKVYIQGLQELARRASGTKLTLYYID
jgi:hypothetical protein